MNSIETQVIMPLDNQPGWFIHHDTKSLYRRYDDRDLYYRVDEQGNPLPPKDLDYDAEIEEELITLP